MMSDIFTTYFYNRRYVKRQSTLQPTKKPITQKSSDNEQEQPRPKDYFTMCLVNGYGSQVLRNLTDDDTQLRLNS